MLLGYLCIYNYRVACKSFYYTIKFWMEHIFFNIATLYCNTLLFQMNLNRPPVSHWLSNSFPWRFFFRLENKSNPDCNLDQDLLYNSMNTQSRMGAFAMVAVWKGVSSWNNKTPPCSFPWCSSIIPFHNLHIIRSLGYSR